MFDEQQVENLFRQAIYHESDREAVVLEKEISSARLKLQKFLESHEEIRHHHKVLVNTDDDDKRDTKKKGGISLTASSVSILKGKGDKEENVKKNEGSKREAGHTEEDGVVEGQDREDSEGSKDNDDDALNEDLGLFVESITKMLSGMEKKYKEMETEEVDDEENLAASRSHFNDKNACPSPSSSSNNVTMEGNTTTSKNKGCSCDLIPSSKNSEECKKRVLCNPSLRPQHSRLLRGLLQGIQHLHTELQDTVFQVFPDAYSICADVLSQGLVNHVRWFEEKKKGFLPHASSHTDCHPLGKEQRKWGGTPSAELITSASVLKEAKQLFPLDVFEEYFLFPFVPFCFLSSSQQLGGEGGGFCAVGGRGRKSSRLALEKTYYVGGNSSEDIPRDDEKESWEAQNDDEGWDLLPTSLFSFLLWSDSYLQKALLAVGTDVRTLVRMYVEEEEKSGVAEEEQAPWWAAANSPPFLQCSTTSNDERVEVQKEKVEDQSTNVTMNTTSHTIEMNRSSNHSQCHQEQEQDRKRNFRKCFEFFTVKRDITRVIAGSLHQPYLYHKTVEQNFTFTIQFLKAYFELLLENIQKAIPSMGGLQSSKFITYWIYIPLQRQILQALHHQKQLPAAADDNNDPVFSVRMKERGRRRRRMEEELHSVYSTGLYRILLLLEDIRRGGGGGGHGRDPTTQKSTATMMMTTGARRAPIVSLEAIEALAVKRGVAVKLAPFKSPEGHTVYSLTLMKNSPSSSSVPQQSTTLYFYLEKENVFVKRSRRASSFELAKSALSLFEV